MDMALKAGSPRSLHPLTQAASFFFTLLTAWAAMGFRSPKFAVASEVVWGDAT
jgi:hypothetical protein